MTTYFKNIEARVIDQINCAQRSIHVAVAWFTNCRIIEALIARVLTRQGLSVQIVVDENETNRLYFFSRADAMERAGIIIKHKVNGQFLHHKFMVIDQNRVMVGSYNFTERANSNRENLTLIEDPVIANFFEREFEMLTNATYIDENIKLLLRYPKFAQQIISTNYRFSTGDLKKYRSQISVGYCFLADNGLYDDLHYEPGFIFNPICKPAEYEFSLPIGKSALQKWHEGVVIDFGREYYYDYPDDEEGLADYMEQNLKSLNIFYTRKYERIYPLEILEKKIISKANIIIEDYLWPVNFFPFFNSRILETVMNTLPDLFEDDHWKRDNYLIKRKPAKLQKTNKSDQG